MALNPPLRTPKLVRDCVSGYHIGTIQSKATAPPLSDTLLRQCLSQSPTGVEEDAVTSAGDGEPPSTARDDARGGESQTERTRAESATRQATVRPTDSRRG